MENSIEKKETKNTTIKLTLYILSILIVITSIIYGVISLSSIFSSGFSTDIFMFPLLMVKRLLPTTIFVVILSVFLIFNGVNKPKFWFTVPMGITLIGIYWFIVNLTVYNAYVEKFMK